MKRFFALLCVLAAVEASAQVGTAPGVIVKDEGTTQGRARSIDFVGSTVSCGISGGAGTCTFTAPTVTPATLNDATYCPDVGASDAYVCSMVSAPSSYAAGMLVTLKANTANTGTASVNVNSLGVKTITRSDGSTLVTGDITATSPVLLEYDGTNFRMLSTPSFVARSLFGSSTGATTIGSSALSGAIDTLTVNNGAATGTILALQNNGSTVFNFADPDIALTTFGSGWSINPNNGAVVMTGQLSLNNNQIVISGNAYGINFANTGAFITNSTTLTPDAPNFLTGAISNSWHFNELGDYLYDFQNPCLTGLGTVACTDPTLILHSATQATNQAMSLGHNRTQGVVTANGGVLARSLTYASGSDVGLTVQGSLTGNIQEWKNSANTRLTYLDSAGKVIAPDATGYQFASSVGGGFGLNYRSPSNQIEIIHGANAYFGVNTVVGTIVSTDGVSFSSSTVNAGTVDTRLRRHSAGVLVGATSATDITGLIGGGAAVASATALPVPTGRVFHVTGTTTITSITSTNFASGAVITLIFDGVLTFTDGSNLKLAGDFVTTADDTITLVYDGTNWYEIARSVN